jgi:hypothetical protein
VELKLVQDPEQKKAAQARMEQALKADLVQMGTRRIGFRSGHVEMTVYSAGEGKIWAAFGEASNGIPRYWNPFGIYKDDQSSQTIAVEINIPSISNKADVAGFFAEDTNTGDIYLMHSGKVGGGRRGVGKSAFLTYLNIRLPRVSKDDGGDRNGIIVAKLGAPDFVERISAFMNKVEGFKAQVTGGAARRE